MQLAGDSNASRAILGQFVFGGGWYTALYFSNGSVNQVSFTVNFIGDDGNPLNVPSLNGSSKTITLAPGGSTVLEAPNLGSLQGICIGHFARRCDRLRSVPAECPRTPRSGSSSALSLPQRNGSDDGLRRYQRYHCYRHRQPQHRRHVDHDYRRGYQRKRDRYIRRTPWCCSQAQDR